MANKKSRITNRQAKISHKKRLRRNLKAKIEHQKLRRVTKDRLKRYNLPPEKIEITVS